MVKPIVRKLPAGLSTELLTKTARIRKVLDEPRMLLWGSFRLQIERRIHIFEEVLVHRKNRNTHQRTWEIVYYGHTEPESLKQMGYERYRPNEIHNFASRHFGYAELGGNDDNTEKIKEMQYNAILEKAMVEIDRLKSEIEEMKLRPPELGGETYVESKCHWDSLT